MPKRIIRTERERQSFFMSGFNAGSNAVIFGLQITHLRDSEVEPIADKINVPTFEEEFHA